ncbi:MAG: hypothetical protein MJ238_03950, partial [Bacilli bacterium]|nr:hypothetical protein [Bacilli bacterium]
MKKSKLLLVLASTSLLVSCGGGNSTSKGNGGANNGVCDNSYNYEAATTKESEEALATIKEISKALFGSCEEGVDYEYDAEYDTYVTSAIWENSTIEKAGKEAEEYVPDCFKYDSEYPSGVTELFGVEFYAAYFLSNNSDLCVDVYAFDTEDGNVAVEYDVYVLAEDIDDPGEDDDDDPIDGPLEGAITYGDGDCIQATKEIATNLFGTAEEGEDWDYYSLNDYYYVMCIWTDEAGKNIAPSIAIEEAVEYLPAGAYVDPEYPAENEDGVYGIYYLWADGKVNIDIYAYEEEGYGTIVEYDIYLLEDEPGNDNPSNPGGDDPTGDYELTYGNSQCISMIEGIAQNLFGSAVSGEDYDYDSDYDIYWTACIADAETYEKAVTEGIEYLPAGCKEDPSFPRENESDYAAAYYLSANGEVSIDIYAYDTDDGIAIEYDVYLTGESGDSGTGTGGTTDEGDTGDGEKFASLSFEGYTSADSAKFDRSISAGAVTFSATLGTNSSGNDPMYYKSSDSLRLYWGNTLNITVSSGYYITAVEIVRTSDAPSDKIHELDKMVPSTGTWNASDGVGTLSIGGTNTTNVSFSVNATKG